MAVSIDEAWGDSLNAAVQGMNDNVELSRECQAPQVTEQAAPVSVSDDGRKRRRSKSAKFARELPVADPDTDLKILIEEVRALRLDEVRRSKNMTLMFVIGLAVLILFSAFAIHSHQKVQNTLSCMAWNIQTSSLLRAHGRYAGRT